MHEEPWLPRGNLCQERTHPARMRSQPLVFLSRPSSKMLVEQPEAPVQLGLVVAPVIVEPASHDGIHQLCEVSQGLVAALLEVPTPHGLSYRFTRHRTDTRIEAVEVLTLLVPGSPRSKLVSQERERHVLM